MSAVEYRGHAPDSGIQLHSIGDIYPYIVFREAIDGQDYFRIMRRSGEHNTALFRTYDEAYDFAVFYKVITTELERKAP